MKKYLAFVAIALAASAFAIDTVNTPWSTEQYVLKRDTTTLAGGAYATKALCQAAAASAVATLGKSSNITCQGTSSARFTVLPACAAAPAAIQTNACTNGGSPNWTQTRAVTTLVRTKATDACYSVGTWSPEAMPSMACLTPVTITWSNIAYETCVGMPAGCTTNFTLTADKNVRFGVFRLASADQPTPVIKRFAAGTYPCTVATFGSDPKSGSSKSCEVSSEVLVPTPPPTPPEPPASGPVTMPGNAFFNVDLTKTPTLLQSPRGGWDKPMIIPATSQPTPSDVGAFRTGCQAVAVLPDDPIVYPGQPGKSHAHIFFGAVGVNANTTTESLRATTHATCRGGPSLTNGVNSSSYWVPALIDIRTGAPVAPRLEGNFYYKRHTAMPTSLKISPIPQGFRMIAGDSKGTPTSPSNAALYACVWQGGNSNWTNYIPTNCQVNGDSWLIVGVDFPSCWDGTNLDSPDHKSHVRSPINPGPNGGGYCPSSHPVAIPFVAYQILYDIQNANDLKYWRLSSDNYAIDQPAGYSGHGDLFSMWNQDIEATWLAGCVNALKDCSSHLLGDGRQLVIP